MGHAVIFSRFWIIIDFSHRNGGIGVLSTPTATNFHFLYCIFHQLLGTVTRSLEHKDALALNLKPGRSWSSTPGQIVFPRVKSHQMAVQLSVGDIDRQLEQLKRCELIKESEVKALCAKAREILIEEENIIRISPPVTVSWLVESSHLLQVCGDIHGQFYDLKELFKIGDDCPETNYLFMGDFVDRGFYSVETFLYLLLLKVCLLSTVTEDSGSLPWSHQLVERKPREQTNHSSVWVLRRVPSQVWQRERLALLYRNLWSLGTYCRDWRTTLCSTWRIIS